MHVVDADWAFDGWLGVRYAPQQTLFRLWAPTATAVTMVIYADATPTAPRVRAIALTRGVRGVWTLALPGDQDQLVYTYRLRFGDGATNETIDPYATAATLNGGRGVVLAPDQVRPAVWGPRLPPFGSATDAVITEVSIRDLTASPTSGVRHRGQYLGLTEAGTHTAAGTPTGLDALVASGATHVQLMPFFDFGSVDEAHPQASYNWGYDPVNVNVPEGSFASDPATPRIRLLEAKQMIQALHQRGLRVIMDVVYNHVYDPTTSPLALTVPGYFFRYNADGTLADGTGVGNDLASERAMARKYIVDSVVYWAREYQLDGFRFDLMGVLDVETMQAVQAALATVAPGLLLLGEGWDLNTPLPAGHKATQTNAAKLPGIAFFNDGVRDAVKGSVFDPAVPGFVNGDGSKAAAVAAGLLGAGAPYVAPTQVVQYVEAHDNLTLADKLAATAPDEPEAQRVRRVELANAIIALSQGLPFFQFGQGFLRSKGGAANSYAAGDAVNAIDWTLADRYRASQQALQALLALRRREPALRQTSYARLAASSRVLQAAQGVVVVQVDSLVLGLNATDEAVTVAVPAGDYLTLVDGAGVHATPVPLASDGRALIDALAPLVLKQLT